MEDTFYTPGPESQNPSSTPLPQITMESLSYLNIAAKWTKFLAIIGFIGIAFLVLLGLFMGVVLNLINIIPNESHFPFPMRFLGFIYFILAGAYLLPVIYLNNFSNYITRTINFRETTDLTLALANLKSHFKYVGIMTIVIIATYIVFFIGVMVFSVSHAMHTM